MTHPEPQKNWWDSDEAVAAAALQFTVPRATLNKDSGDATRIRLPNSIKGRHEFRILTGAHRDAAFVLGNGDLLVLGSDASCDIQLTDPGVSQRHATLTVKGKHASIRALDGVVTVDGKAVTANDRVALQPGAEIALGGSDVRMQLVGDAITRPFAAAAASAQPEAAAAASADAKNTLPRRRQIMLALLALSPLIIGVAATYVFRGSPPAAAAPEPEMVSLRMALVRDGLDKQVEVSDTAYGAVLSGVVDRESADKLRKILATLHAPFIDSTILESDFIEQVRDGFRTRGYDAAATYLGEGRVRIENLDVHSERVEQAAAQVRSDIAQLRELIFTAPADSQPPAHVPLYENKRGEKLSLQINGDLAYLATADGSRYFAGSILPSGHTVLRITRDAVQIERDGQMAWVRF